MASTDESAHTVRHLSSFCFFYVVAHFSAAEKFEGFLRNVLSKSLDSLVAFDKTGKPSLLFMLCGENFP